MCAHTFDAEVEVGLGDVVLAVRGKLDREAPVRHVQVQRVLADLELGDYDKVVSAEAKSAS